MQEILRHLCRGWHGFVMIVKSASDAGERLSAEDLDWLRKAHVELEAVIQQQQRLDR